MERRVLTRKCGLNVCVSVLFCDIVSSNESDNIVNVTRRLRRLDQYVNEARWRVSSASNDPESFPVSNMFATIVTRTHQHQVFILR